MSKCFFVLYFFRSGIFLGIILQRNALGCVTFQFADHLCIHLSCGKVAVGKQFAHGVDVRASCQLQGGEGMPEAVQNYQDCRLKQMKAVGTVNGCK